MSANEPWLNEPNEARFESHGYKCAIHRQTHSGHLCGYVGVPASHPWFGKTYNDTVKPTPGLLERSIDIDKVGAINVLCATGRDNLSEACDIVLLIDVHGGLTYSDNGKRLLDDKSLWVFGFDCAHAGDLSPFTAAKLTEWGFDSRDDVYRDFDYVKREVESLAAQLAKIEQDALK